MTSLRVRLALRMSPRSSTTPGLLLAASALSLAACLGLAGCGGGDDPVGNDTPPPSAELVAVPSVHGLDVGAAVEALCDAGLNVDIIQTVDSGLDQGSLSGESAPRGGAEAQTGTNVALQVSSRRDGMVSPGAPDGCSVKVVEVRDEPGGRNYGDSP